MVNRESPRMMILWIHFLMAMFIPWRVAWDSTWLFEVVPKFQEYASYVFPWGEITTPLSPSSLGFPFESSSKKIIWEDYSFFHWEKLDSVIWRCQWGLGIKELEAPEESEKALNQTASLLSSDWFKCFSLSIVFIYWMRRLKTISATMSGL